MKLKNHILILLLLGATVYLNAMKPFLVDDCEEVCAPSSIKVVNKHRFHKELSLYYLLLRKRFLDEQLKTTEYPDIVNALRKEVIIKLKYT